VEHRSAPRAGGRSGVRARPVARGAFRIGYPAARSPIAPRSAG